jgi:hypothetical protein
MGSPRRKPNVTDERARFLDPSAVSQPKVNEFDLMRVIFDHEILWFEVAMQIPCLVEQLDRCEALVS